MKTHYFSNCAGVFEGGGVRAVAYAGAYLAAEEAGIRFSRVAGSSAGSIAAAFIATGGDPEKIKSQLMDLDMAALQRPPNDKGSLFPKPGKFVWALSKVPGNKIQSVTNFLQYFGNFSSDDLQKWVEKSLRELLGESDRQLPDRPVRFSDLKVPLYVLAADVLQKSPKIWCLDTTPEDSVAFAIQASCAIPFHFQPVFSAQSAFVDGGAVSNLPSHVFPPMTKNFGRFSEKTLAFRLNSKPKEIKTAFVDATDYAFSIADTVVASATMIQQTLQDGIFPIVIDTEDVGSTDFEKMTDAKKLTLLENGKEAVRNFVAREREVVGKHRTSDVYQGYDERLLAYVHAVSEAKQSIWISDISTYWLYFIFPIIASAIESGVTIKVFLQELPSKGEAQEQKRRKSLVSMGCEVVTVGELDFTGLVVDFHKAEAIAVISSENGNPGADFDYSREQVRLYSSDSDLPVIRNLGNTLKRRSEDIGSSKPVSGTLSVVPLDSGKLYAELKKVPQYNRAKFIIENVDFDENLRVSQTHIKEFKLLQIEELVLRLTKGGFALFTPCQYELKDGSFSIITPPILELTPSGPVIIEGHSRAFYLAKMGQKNFQAVVVSNVLAPLPVEPMPFSSLQIADETMTAARLLPAFDRKLFRHIEQIMHP